MTKKTQQFNANNFPVPKAKCPEPGMTAEPGVPDIREFYKFRLAEIQFLQEFAKDLDIPRAAKYVGWSQQQTSNELAKPAMRDEMLAVYDAWRKTVYMTAEVASGRFLKNLEKLERAFDDGETSVASAMAKMSSDYLKATGHFDNTGGSTAPQVQINIDIGAPETKQSNVGVTIDGVKDA